MKKLTFYLIFLSNILFATDTLMHALLDGNLTHKINANYHEGNDNDDEETPYASSRTQKILFHYQTAPYDGLRFEVATQSFAKQTHQNSVDNTLYYTEALYQTNTDKSRYALSANYYADTYKEAMNQKELETTNAFGLKAQLKYDNFGSYVAYSKVFEGSHSVATSLDGKDHLLPTSSVLSSNNYAPNTEAYAFDVNYSPRKNVTVGSRYVIATDDQTNLSYTGIYSNFQLTEIAKGVNLGIAYDKTGTDKQNNQLNFSIKSKF